MSQTHHFKSWYFQVSDQYEHSQTHSKTPRGFNTLEILKYGFISYNFPNFIKFPLLLFSCSFENIMAWFLRLGGGGSVLSCFYLALLFPMSLRCMSFSIMIILLSRVVGQSTGRSLSRVQAARLLQSCCLFYGSFILI